MSRVATLAQFLLALALAASPAGPIAARQQTDWPSRWAEDLEVVREALAAHHADAFHTLTRAEWDEAIDQLVAATGRLAHHELAVELARVVALVGDGHTRLTLPLAEGVSFPQGHSSTPPPALPELVFHAFPVRFAVEQDEVFVEAIAREHGDLVGARVLRLGALETAAALEAVSPTIHRDNDMQVLHHLPMYLALAEVLHARGVIPTRDTLELVVEDRTGGARTLRLSAAPAGSAIDWARAPAITPAARLAESLAGGAFAFEYLPAERTVYFRFDEVNDTAEESLRDFASRLEARLVVGDVDTLIVDLRHNRGGNNWLARPVLKAIVRGRQDRPGRLLVLIGRSTFSAAMDFALALETYTNALFVGEPTGARPNSYGDSRRVRLPNTGLTVRVSTRYHQNNYTDGRAWLPPDVPVGRSRADYLAGDDPVLATALALADAPAVRPALGRWEGRLKWGLNTVALTLELGSVTGPLRVSAPGLDIEGATADDLQVGPGRLSFSVDSPYGTLPFVAEVRGGWIAGSYTQGGIAFPFVARASE